MQKKLKTKNLKLKTISKIVKFVLILFAFTFYLLPFTSLHASHCPSTDYDCQISEIQREIDAISGAHEKNKAELASLKKQIDDLTKRISSLSTQLKSVEGQITQREEDLAYAKEIFEEKAENHYKFLRLYDPIMPFLASNHPSHPFPDIKFFHFNLKAR